MKKILFPDTNVFLHYQSFDQIDLLGLLDCDEVQIVIVLLVLDEVDDHKWSHSYPKIRERAQSATKRISAWQAGKEAIRSGISLGLHSVRPADTTMKQMQLNPRSNDDLLFGTIVEYGHSKPNQELILLTGDTGSALRAESFGLAVAVLPDDYLLPPAINEAQKKANKLRQELDRLRNRMPLLNLFFADTSNQLEVNIEAQIPVSTESMRGLLDMVEADIQQRAARYFDDASDEAPLRSSERAANLIRLGIRPEGLSFFNEPSKQEIERYRSEVEEFSGEYKGYLLEKREVQNEHRRTLRLDLIISNVGSALAEDILLTLTVPDHLIWRQEPGEWELPDLPQFPAPPRSPANILLEETGLMQYRSVPFDIGSQYSTGAEGDQPEPVIANSGLVIEWEIGDCRQHRTLPLAPLFVMFREGDRITNFQIEYRIHAKNIPEPVEGRLLVVANQQELREDLSSVSEEADRDDNEEE